MEQPKSIHQQRIVVMHLLREQIGSGSMFDSLHSRNYCSSVVLNIDSIIVLLKFRILVLLFVVVVSVPFP